MRSNSNGNAAIYLLAGIVVLIIVAIGVFTVVNRQSTNRLNREYTEKNVVLKGEQVKTVEVDALKKELVGTYIATIITKPADTTTTVRIIKPYEEQHILRIFPDGHYTYAGITGLNIQNYAPKLDSRSGNYKVLPGQLTLLDFIPEDELPTSEDIVDKETSDVTFAYTLQDQKLVLEKDFNRPAPSPSNTPLSFLTITPSVLNLTYGFTFMQLTKGTSNTQLTEIQHFIKTFEDNIQQGNLDGVYAVFNTPATETELRNEQSFAATLSQAQTFPFTLVSWEYGKAPNPPKGTEPGPIETLKNNAGYRVYVTESRTANPPADNEKVKTRSVVFEVVDYFGAWKISRYFFANEDVKTAKKFSAFTL